MVKITKTELPRECRGNERPRRDAGAFRVSTATRTSGYGAFRFTFAQGASIRVCTRLVPEFFCAFSDAVLPRHPMSTPSPAFLLACTPEKIPHLLVPISTPVPPFPVDLLATTMLSPPPRSIPSPPFLEVVD